MADRTNNYSETLNNTINSITGKKPSVWKLIDNLKLIELHKSDELKNNMGGLMIETQQSNEIIRLNKKIIQATDLFKKDQNIEAFLKNITFKDRLESFFTARIFIEGLDNESEFIDDDDCESEIIPNWLNPELNFVRKPLKRKASTQASTKASNQASTNASTQASAQASTNDKSNIKKRRTTNNGTNKLRASVALF